MNNTRLSGMTGPTVIGVAAVLALGLSGCGGQQAPAETRTESQTASASATPTPTPTKTFGTAELGAVVEQFIDSRGYFFTIQSPDELAAQQEQLKAVMAGVQVEPAECKAMALSGMSQQPDGAQLVTGTSVDNAGGNVEAVSLATGLDPAALQKNLETSASQANLCGNMAMTVSGVQVQVTVVPIDASAWMPQAVAYRTDVALPSGPVQSTVTSFAAKSGVMVSAVVAGKDAAVKGADAARALLVQADKLLS